MPQTAPESPSEPDFALELIDPHRYASSGYPHETWARLRREAPVRRCEPPGWEPFWAITRHADICAISKDPETFSNAEGIILMTAELARRQRERGRQSFAGMRTIIEMDPPEHRGFRKVASGWFTPRSLGRLDAAVRESAVQLVDELVDAARARGGEASCDFVARVSARHPLRILSAILGIPREDEPAILRMTNELFGSDDPDFQPSADKQRNQERLGIEFYQYFSKIIADRRARPRDDLASVLAHGEIDGRRMGDVETFGYYLITFTAGHETTRNAVSGGLLALAQHPEQWRALRRDPSLIPSAVEEIVRWTTPVNYMKRSATRDVEFQGQKLRAGDRLLLFYASANRDESVFDDPYRFRVDRQPNPHLGFGIGEHFCLGSHLARASQRALLRELTSRIESIELAGEPARVHAAFVAGLKQLPIRYRIAAADPPGRE